MVTLTEILMALNSIDGDNSWSEKKKEGLDDNVNSMAARIMLKLSDLKEKRMIGGQNVAKLESALLAISPIAKLVDHPDQQFEKADVTDREKIGRQRSFARDYLEWLETIMGIATRTWMNHHSKSLG